VGKDFLQRELASIPGKGGSLSKFHGPGGREKEVVQLKSSGGDFTDAEDTAIFVQDNIEGGATQGGRESGGRRGGEESCLRRER